MAADRLGLGLSTSPEAASAYVAGVDRMLAAWPGAGERLAEALRLDPDFAAGHAAMARLEQMDGRLDDARASAARAQELARRATRRERQQVRCVALLVEGKAAAALAAIEEHVDAFPRDSLALSLALGAFGLYAFSGRADHDAARLALCEKLAPHQPGDDWWFLTYLGWGHTEAGNLDAGQRITRRGFELRRENAHGAHALAHSFHECGQHEAGVAHLDDWLPGYGADGQLHCHVNWHRALLDLQAGDAAGALARFREQMHPALSRSPPINVMTDGASLLWRIMLYEEAPPELPWRDLAGYAEATWPRPVVPFIDVHCAMAAAGDGDGEAVDRRAEVLAARHAAGSLPQGPVPATLMAAADAFAQGDHAGAADHIETVLPELARLGGSHAQREVHEETLIAASLRAGRTARARELIEQRLARRPCPVDSRWLAQTGAGA